MSPDNDTACLHASASTGVAAEALPLTCPNGCAASVWAKVNALGRIHLFCCSACGERWPGSATVSPA